MMKPEQLYETAVNSVTKVISQGAFVNIVVDETISGSAFDDSERRLYTRLVYGTVEKRILIDFYLSDFIKGKRLKPFLKNTLRVAVYALEFLSLAHHFIVDISVEIVKKKDFKGSRLVNAVLRQYLSTSRPDVSRLPYRDYLSTRYSYPADVVDLLLDQYPKEAEKILQMLEEPKTDALRINTLKTSADEVKKRLDAENIPYTIDDGALYIGQSMIGHPLFEAGAITYQDRSSQRVSLVVDPHPSEKILDACSAPGGKTAHMAALSQNEASIVACDIHEHKLKLMEENFRRLGVKGVQLLLADARDLPKQFSEKTFDKILVDAPCSGLGVMGHKVDIKYQLDQGKLSRLKELQQEILEKVRPLLKDEGCLVYSTCTINQEENQQQIRAFMKRHPDFTIIHEESILPDARQDGFYICKLAIKIGK